MPALLNGIAGFSRDTAVVPIGIAALPAAFGGVVTVLPVALCGETDTLDAEVFWSYSYSEHILLDCRLPMACNKIWRA